MGDNAIEKKRKELKMTQGAMAAKHNITRQHYNAVVNFKKPPSVELAKNLAVSLDLDWTIFFVDQVNV